MKILIADDHASILEGIAAYYKRKNSAAEVCKAVNKSELIFHLKESTFDVLVQDVQFGKDDLRDIVEEIRAVAPNLPILAFSSFKDVATIKSVLGKGVIGYVSKSSSLEELISGIESSLVGERYLSKDISEVLTKEVLGESNEFVLTKREREVLDAILAELSTKEIAEKLCLSEKTIEGYRKNLFIKFDVKNVAGLVRKAIIGGYLN